MGITIEQVLKAARNAGASDVHLIAGIPPAFRVNDEIILAKGEPLSREQTRDLVYGLIGPEQRVVFEKEKQVCVSIHDSVTGRIRVTAYFHAGSPEAAIRMGSLKVQTVAELGLPPVVEEFARKPNGLVLVCGPTGVGKTTTMNCMIDLINRERRCKIVTIEDPVEYVHQRIKAIIVQLDVYTDTLSFSGALVHVLRQDPDVIVIGEMRDRETISTALTAAETGHLVIATLHTRNTAQAMERIVNVFPEDAQAQILIQLGSTLQGVLGQDLLPRADGSGRVLACEVLIATTAVRAMIRENNLHLVYNVLQAGHKEGMQTMDKSLLELYQKGVITYDIAVARARYPDSITRRMA